MASHRLRPSITAIFMAYVRAELAGSASIRAVRIGPFVASFALDSTSRHLNYAIPDDGAEPNPSEIEALVLQFRERALVPRLEFVADTAPVAQQRLSAAGFVEEARLPLLAADRVSIVELGPPEGIDLIRPAGDEALLAMVTMQNALFAEPEPLGPPGLARLRAALASGALAVVAVDGATGATVGAGQSSVPRSGAVELIGVAVVPERRGRGLAGAIVSRLARDAFASGVEGVFVEAEIGADGAYRRAGFRDVSSIVHLALPQGTPGDS